jgi:VanZ family protein
MISWFERYPVISSIITLIIACIIFYVSSWTAESIGQPIWSWQATAYHFVAFFFLCAFMMISLVSGKLKRKQFIAIGLLLCLAYAVSDEFHQHFVPGRSCSISDFFIDSAGIYLACLIYCARIHFKKYRKLC